MRELTWSFHTLFTSFSFSGKWQKPAQTMLSHQTNLLLHVTEKSKEYVSGTARSRGSRDAIGPFFTHPPRMWVSFLGRLSPRGGKIASGSSNVMRSF